MSHVLRLVVYAGSVGEKWRQVGGCRPCKPGMLQPKISVTALLACTAAVSKITKVRMLPATSIQEAAVYSTGTNRHSSCFWDAEMPFPVDKSLRVELLKYGVLHHVVVTDQIELGTRTCRTCQEPWLSRYPDTTP